MAIQNRRGNYADFDENKMLPGEFAYALDTAELFYCVAPGTVRRCATKEELEQILTSAPEAYSALQELIADLENQTVLTGILADINNLKSTKLAITGDSKTNTTTFVEASTLANINSAETHATLFGKIKKFFSFVGTTTLTTTAQTVSAAANEILAANRSGWSTLLVTDKLTYKSASAPTFVCNTLNTSNVAKDMRPYLSVGMKLKMTQAAVVKYFFITAIDATSITLYGGTDYVLTTTAVTNVCYSVVKSPYGFPMSPSKWSVQFIRNTTTSISPVTAGVWKSSDIALTVPIGDWQIYFKSTSHSIQSSATYGSLLFITLSTNLTTETNIEFTSYGGADSLATSKLGILVSTAEATVRLESSTVFTLLGKIFMGVTTDIVFEGNKTPTTIRATCAYL